MGATRLERGEGCARLILSGSFRVEEAAALKQDLLDALNVSPALAVDLTDLVSADLTFYQLLCSARRSAATRGGALDITGFSEKVLETARRHGLATVFEDRCL